MSEHVYTRLSGYGLIFVPRVPFELWRSPDHPPDVFLSHQAAGGLKQATVLLDQAGHRVHLAPGTASVSDVGIFSSGTYTGDWRIETTAFTIPWPVGFTILSSPDPGTPPGFDLHGPDNALVYFQGPFDPRRLPPREAMAAPGQTLRHRGHSVAYEWVEFTYDHDGQSWLQRHHLVPLALTATVVVTAQTRTTEAEATLAAAASIAQALRAVPWRPTHGP